MHLNLRRRSLTAWPAPHPQFHGVDSLDLGFNHLRDLAAFASSSWPKLTRLWLHNNHLRTLPADLAAFARLRELDLSYNQLEFLPESFGELTALEVLHLQGNRLRELPPSFARLSRLRRLVIHENILGHLPENFGQLAALEHLDASSNQLRQLPDLIGDCRDLSWLVLSNNRIDQLPREFGRLNSLRRAFLTHNQLSDLPPPAIASHLAQLEISDNTFPRHGAPNTRTQAPRSGASAGPKKTATSPACPHRSLNPGSVQRKNRHPIAPSFLRNHLTRCAAIPHKLRTRSMQRDAASA